MKPISTLMKPLRSVDLTTMAESPAAIERSDVCAVPAAAVVGEAMVALVLADALLDSFGGDSIADLDRALAASADAVRDSFPAAMIRPILRYGARRTPRAGRRRRDVRRHSAAAGRRHDRDHVCGAGRGAGRDAGRRAHTALRRSICPPDGIRKALITMVNPRFVDARRHAARGRRMPEHSRFNATVVRPAQATVVRLRPARPTADHRGHDLLARAFQHEMDHLDGTVFVDRLRGIKRDLIVRQIQKMKRAGKW